MATQRTGSAKENLYYHNALILHKIKKQTVKNQYNSSSPNRNRLMRAPLIKGSRQGRRGDALES